VTVDGRMRTGWFLMAFEKRGTALVHEVRLARFGLPTMRRLWPRADDDELAALQYPVDRRVAKVLARYTRMPIALEEFDYFLGAYRVPITPVRRVKAKER
jgi:hypothetical protein